MDYDSKDYVKETGLSEKDTHELKEAFKVKYAEQMGWIIKDLTSKQLLEIQDQDGYKNAGRLFS